MERQFINRLLQISKRSLTCPSTFSISSSPDPTAGIQIGFLTKGGGSIARSRKVCRWRLLGAKRNTGEIPVSTTRSKWIKSQHSTSSDDSNCFAFPLSSLSSPLLSSLLSYTLRSTKREKPATKRPGDEEKKR